MHDDGGPAYPSGAVKDDHGDTHPMFAGKSLRDWFAGQALVGELLVLAQADILNADPEETARRAYFLADAMLAERKREEADG